jgi:hypothetical protein
MQVKLTTLTGGQLSVESIYDPMFDMELTRASEQTCAETPNDLPETKWVHPITQDTYIHKTGNLYKLVEEEKEAPWTYESTSLNNLLNFSANLNRSGLGC